MSPSREVEEPGFESGTVPHAIPIPQLCVLWTQNGSAGSQSGSDTQSSILPCVAKVISSAAVSQALIKLLAMEFSSQFFKVKRLGSKWQASKQRACPVTISSPFHHFFPICFLHAEYYWETMMSALPYKSTPPCLPLPYNAYFCSSFWLLSCCSAP